MSGLDENLINRFSSHRSQPSDQHQLCKAQHCFYCIESIYNCLRSDGSNPSESFKPSKVVLDHLRDLIGQHQYPLFVTWNVIRSDGSHRLRGCIGNFSPSSLIDGLKEYAIISALRDHRFKPITISELQKLSCTVSLLHTFEDCDSITDWSVGIHGIYIHLPERLERNDSNNRSQPSTIQTNNSNSTTTKTDDDSQNPDVVSKEVRNCPRSWSISKGKKHYLSATYLPEVAAEQGWTKLEAIDSAICKAGWQGAITDEVRNSVVVERYQSSKWENSFKDWKDWRESAGFPLQ
ncbi:AMMECR1 domain-containing protein [Phakopsora pachyrhizi]|uniref:AMMECR1 domain-containing protein n=1 Tax=Phakopsora pachyrhizi TaxID=170000 RepID=A0AAV0BEY9_PHAPC|nr:AMMECR1 domain-containing protein [Phakopsora pachyrhizi]CAH7684563.1 AMMECR1 domain-containing protein [Phakopsora pachyrhizi]